MIKEIAEKNMSKGSKIKFFRWLIWTLPKDFLTQVTKRNFLEFQLLAEKRFSRSAQRRRLNILATSLPKGNRTAATA